MDELYRKRAGALADKYGLVRLPVAPKHVGDGVYPSPTNEAYTEIVLATFIRLDHVTPATGQDDVARRLADDSTPAIEVIPDPRVDDPNEYIIRVTDTADSSPLVGYYEASNLDIGYVFGTQVNDPWGVYHYDESYFDETFVNILRGLSVFDDEGQNRVERVREFRQHFEENSE